MAEEPSVSQEAHGNYIAQATHGASATVNIYASPPSVENQNRARFLVRLRTRYRELLSGSLHGAVRMQLHLAGYPDAVTPPVQLLYEADQQPIRPLPPSTSLIQMYEEAGHELLVLGAPGSGKSTLLLELALDLVGSAEQDHHQLFPVIVPLSSWATKRQPLEQWLAPQIALLYDIALPLATRWMQQERFLLLLDGLDEMEEETRAACIEAINAYHHTHLHPLVVCSRKAEYEAAAIHTRLVLHSAVEVQPLTRGQVDAYLVQCGESVAALRTALRENPVLREIATTPLMLSILILTYQGQTVNNLPATGSLREQQQQIFTHYVQRMMARKGRLARFSQKDILSWLSWLARQMRERNQTIFYLEYLQPDWLPNKRSRRFYRSLVVLITEPIYILLLGLAGMLNSQPFNPRASQDWMTGLAGGMAMGLIFGLFFGLRLALGKLNTRGLGGRKEEIQVMGITWFKPLLLAGVLAGQLLTLVLLLFILLQGKLSTGLDRILINLLVYGLFGVLFGGAIGMLTGGISGKRLEKGHLMQPNQGIHYSAQSAALSGLSIIVLFGVSWTIFLKSISGLAFGLMFGPMGLTFGGGACLQHYVIRFLLTRSHSFPWHAPRFLEAAAARILLRRVGGGYSFPHRLLLDYFADLPDIHSDYHT